MSFETIPEQLGITDPWIEKGGVHWLTPGPLSVRDLAKTMNAVQARFITITATELPGEEGFRLEYHWDLDGQLLGLSLCHSQQIHRKHLRPLRGRGLG